MPDHQVTISTSRLQMGRPNLSNYVSFLELVVSNCYFSLLIKSQNEFICMKICKFDYREANHGEVNSTTSTGKS